MRLSPAQSGSQTKHLSGFQIWIKYSGVNEGSVTAIFWLLHMREVIPVQPSGQYMYSTVVTICTASLTFNNSTFCPHTVFMCFVWISEQAAIISLYNINWLVCITEKECVYCAVRTGSLNKIQFNLYLTPFLLHFSMFTFSAACLYWKGERANIQINKYSIILLQ